MTQSKENWKPCRKGQLGKLVDGLNTSRDRTAMTRRVAIGGGLLAIFCGAALTFGVFNGPKPIVMSCAEVKGLTTEFVSGTLDDERTEGIRAHLAGCEYCKVHMDKASEAFQRRSEVSVASR